MDNVKNDKYYIDKILVDLEFLIEHTQGLTKEDIEINELLLDSIMFRIIQISENSNKLTDAFKENNKSIPWVSLKGMRNRIVHDYGEVDYSIIIDTVLVDIPEVYELIKKRK